MMNLWELLQKNYIPAPRYCKESWLNMSKMDTTWDWIAIDRVPIKKIKIDKMLMSFPNDVDDDEVTHMINNFEEDVWEPILINSDYYLLDGQHRLQLAFRTGIKFIDVIMEKKKDSLVSKKVKDAIKRKEELEKLMDTAIL